ncbi:MAG: hypothetical protein ACR2QO_23725 [Acidimicrobiales bacterium]
MLVLDGFLLGDNHNMPVFRWYEKDACSVLVTNRPDLIRLTTWLRDAQGWSRPSPSRSTRE